MSNQRIAAASSGTAFTNYGAATNASVVAAPAMLRSICCTNISASLVYLQVFNLATGPAEDSSVPLFSWAVPAGTSTQPGIRAVGADELGAAGYYFSTGLAWGISVDADNWDSTGITASNHTINGIRV